MSDAQVQPGNRWLGELSVKGREIATGGFTCGTTLLGARSGDVTEIS